MGAAEVRRYASLARSVGAEMGVDPALILAVIDVESGGNPAAWRDEIDQPGSAIDEGSHGLMQILYSTARGWGYSGPPGVRANLSGLFDPVTNVRTGTTGLKRLLAQTGGDIARAASAYNGGFRANLGFGTRAVAPVTVCLAWSAATGKCLTSRAVAVGEFGNQPHVDKVLAAYSRWRAELNAGAGTLPTVAVPGTPDSPQPTPVTGVKPGCVAIVIAVTVPILTVSALCL